MAINLNHIDNSISIGTSEKFRIKANGRVGIGTDNPDMKLEVYNGGIKIHRDNAGGSSNPHLTMRTGPTGGSRLMIYAEDYTDDNSNWIYKTNANEEHSFVVTTTEILRLQQNRVGIGQSVPTARLQVAGSNPYAVTDSGRAVEGIDITGTAGGSGNYGAAISFGAGATGRAAITAVQGASDADNVGLAIITHPTGTGANDGVEKIRINSGGRVGIGTNSPDGMLHISSGDADSDCVVIIQSDEDNDDENSNPQIWFKQDGDISAGFVGQSSNKLVFGNSIATSGGIIFKTGTTNNTGTTDPLTGTSERFRIAPDGQVSIRSSSTAFDGTGGLDALQLHYETDSGKTTVASYSSGGSTFLSFATNAGGAVATEKVRIDSAGTVLISEQNNYGNTAIVQLQDNIIGGVRVTVQDETMSSDISVPRKGCIMAITSFTTYDSYPQPGSTDLVYLDTGPSKNIILMTDLSTILLVTGNSAYDPDVADFTDARNTIQPGSADGTFRIVNRTGGDYTFTCTFL